MSIQESALTVDGRQVRVIGQHALAVAACPNFSAYPAIVVIEADGGMRVKSPVESWAECLEFIDNPPATGSRSARLELTRLEFLGLFTDEEKVSLKALEETDPTVALFREEYRTAESIRLDDPRTIRAAGYLSAPGATWPPAARRPSWGCRPGGRITIRPGEAIPPVLEQHTRRPCRPQGES